MSVAMLSEAEIELDELDGVGSSTKQKLLDAGILTIMDLAVRSPHDLAAKAGFELARSVDLVNKARVYLVGKGKLEKDFISAEELFRRRQSVERIDAGCSSLNDLLGGGVETQAMTEFYGEYGSGKTNICHTLAVMVQQPKDKGGLEGTAIYVDTENTFRPERIYQIASKRGFDPEAALKGITVAKAYNSAHQELIVEELGKVIRENNARLVVVDSAVAHYRAEFLGRGTLADRQQRLNRMLHLLLRTAELNNLAIAITNQVQSSPDAYFQNPTQPTGGHVLGHTSTYRIYLRKAGKNRIARMVDSPCHAESEVPFMLDEKGIADVPEEHASRKR